MVALILQGVRQFVGQHRPLRVSIHPVEQVNGLGLGIVEAGDLLLEQAEQKRPQLEIARQQSQLLQRRGGAFKPLGVLVLLHVPHNVLFHFIAIGELPLHLVLDRQPRILADECQNFIDRPEQFLGLFRADFVLGGVRLSAAWRVRLAGPGVVVLPAAERPQSARTESSQLNSRTSNQNSFFGLPPATRHRSPYPPSRQQRSSIVPRIGKACSKTAITPGK